MKTGDFFFKFSGDYIGNELITCASIGAVWQPQMAFMRAKIKRIKIIKIIVFRAAQHIQQLHENP